MRNALKMALAAIITICACAARADQIEYDPAKVSDSLKAIFQFGSSSTKQALNASLSQDLHTMLAMEAVAKTYRYLDAEEIAAKQKALKAEKAKSGKKG